VQVSFDSIYGLSLGIEYLPGIEEDDEKTIIVDLLIIRLLVQWQ
jgi:hypothetical protein